MRGLIKGLAVVGALVGLLVVIAVIVPFLVDFNKFKPQIKAVVADAVNADLEFESARLTILTGIGVELKGVKLTNTDPTFRGSQLFAVDDLIFRVALAPLLSGHFEGYLAIDGPEILIASKGAKNNIASLSKPTVAAQATPEDETPAEEQAPDPETEKMIEEFKSRIVIKAIEISDAVFVLRDLGAKTKKDPVRVTDLDIAIHDIGLERTIKTVISTNVEVTQPGISIAGPIRLAIDTKAHTQGTKFEYATASGALSFDQMAINVRDAFVKRPGIALNLAFDTRVTTNSLRAESFVFHLHQLKIAANAAINNLQSMDLDASVSVVNDQLTSLGEVLPQHSDLLSKGSIQIDAGAKGLLTDLSQLTARLDLDLRLGDSDLRMSTSVQDAKAPELKAEVKSSKLDLGAILGPFLPKDGESAEAEKTAKADKPAPADPNAPPPEDVTLTAEQKDALVNANISANVALQHILFNEIEIRNFIINTRVKGLRAALQPFSMDIFAGNVSFLADVDLAAAPIASVGQLKLDKVEIKEILTTFVPEHKELMAGPVTFALDSKLSGTTVETIKKTLNAKGMFEFHGGKMNSASVADALGNEVDGFTSKLSVAKAADSVFAKVSKLGGGKLIKGLGGSKFDPEKIKARYGGADKVKIADKLKGESDLKGTKGEIEIKDGRVHITSRKASGSGQMLINSSVGLDATLGGGGDFIASKGLRQHMVKQSRYAKLLFDKKGEFALKFTLSGPVSNPKVGLDLKSLEKRFTANAKQLVKAELEGEISKQKNALINEQKAKARAALAKKRKQAQALAAKKKAEAKARAQAAKEKAKQRAKKRAEEEAKKRGKEKAKSKAKDKLKGLGL